MLTDLEFEVSFSKSLQPSSQGFTVKKEDGWWVFQKLGKNLLVFNQI